MKRKRRYINLERAYVLGLVCKHGAAGLRFELERHPLLFWKLRLTDRTYGQHVPFLEQHGFVSVEVDWPHATVTATPAGRALAGVIVNGPG